MWGEISSEGAEPSEKVTANIYIHNVIKSIKVIVEMYDLMIGKFFCKNYHWNPGLKIKASAVRKFHQLLIEFKVMVR